MKDKALDWLDARALYFKSIEVKDTFKAFVEAIDNWFKNDKKAQLALEMMKKDKYAGDILLYIDHIELLNMMVGSHGLQNRDLIKAGLNTKLRDRLSLTQCGEPDEDNALVQAIKEKGLAYERRLEEEKREGKTSDSAPTSGPATGKNLKRKRGGAVTGAAAAPATGTLRSDAPPAKKQSTRAKSEASVGAEKGNPPRFTKEQMEEALKGVQQTLRDARERKKLCLRCGFGGHRWHWCQKDIVVSSVRKKEKSPKGEPSEAGTQAAAVSAAKRSTTMHTVRSGITSLPMQECIMPVANLRIKAGHTSQPHIFEIDSEEESDYRPE